MQLRLFLRDPGQNKWLFCLGVSCCALILTYWPQGLIHFRYDRTGLLSDDGWRLLTAHLVHLNTQHLLFNLLGFFLLCELLWNDMAVPHAFGILGSAAIGISLSLYWLHPELAWYAGLSGALHGLWAGCALAGCRRISSSSDRLSDSALSGWEGLQVRWPLSRCICVAALVLLTAKLAIEFHYGPSERTMRAIGGTVVTAAHLYGAITGICYVLVWHCTRALRLKN